eukprot:6177265-Pleurochrysis_carterae.AAC.2
MSCMTYWTAVAYCIRWMQLYSFGKQVTTSVLACCNIEDVLPGFEFKIQVTRQLKKREGFTLRRYWVSIPIAEQGGDEVEETGQNAKAKLPA